MKILERDEQSQLQSEIVFNRAGRTVLAGSGLDTVCQWGEKPLDAVPTNGSVGFREASRALGTGWANQFDSLDDALARRCDQRPAGG